MDFSPYHDNSCAPSAVNATSSTCASDEDLAAAREGPNTSEDDKKCRGKHDEVSKNHYERFVAHSSLEEAETECSNFKSEQKTINRGGVAEDSVNSDRKREESECVKQFCFASSVEDISVRNFTFSVSSAQDNFSATKRQNRKKYRMKVGHGPNCTTPSQKVDTASSSVQSSPLDSGYLHRIRAQDKEGDIFSSQRKGENKSKGGEEHDKKGSTAATLEACEKWRIRGNQAYEKGYMSEAEEFYTKGINCVLHSEKSGCCVEPLVLCYSNRAAARMSRGRMREALGWHSLKVKDEVQTRKGLRWIPRHPETRKGVVSDEMLRGVENKHRSGDSRIGQPFERLLNPWADKRQPGELKQLSSQRKRKQKRFPE
ncbi:uncharacterized protein LOC114279666 [Camellia sinensis]|uniref:uncharacterized protein LOC114279666 n=1 Tax=Camellia sinensis TaxID=4442 RepID=UPI001035E2B1|nr:uncharacterized protein LOC114279666 [Camellia sinensis]